MHRILVVDDEPLLRNSMLRGLARMSNVHVDDAGSVEEALVAIDKAFPDLIVSDIDLPGRSGITILGELGKQGRSIPLETFQTAHAIDPTGTKVIANLERLKVMGIT